MRLVEVTRFITDEFLGSRPLRAFDVVRRLTFDTLRRALLVITLTSSRASITVV
jgi:hypothetical protein